MDIDIRLTELGDSFYLDQWLAQEGGELGFPAIALEDDVERNEAAIRWVSQSRYGSSLTAEVKGVPVGIATLNLMIGDRLSHHAELSIAVDVSHRGKGIGTKLFGSLLELGEKTFKLREIFIIVSVGNPAKHLYDRFGFEPVGVKKRYARLKNGGYQDVLIMQKSLGET
ncbi:GNAT family N-acetyltransferase [Candidatus Similichlamydia laticola]|uniref:GNAT family acetyltransferase YhhY n=1 Tax=Candidatus Similichlamydia laticola TaxID=2170265 RepID=A0A369K9L5_9BACT|nr:GNAT family N-acetyltransferase [Candidatus Similichlamydia laticola]RDB31281.1 GNAT family acetyltransferase YhhY [Candidatus Similichlamydia laticola]